jgi:GTP-binding protein HflX
VPYAEQKLVGEIYETARVLSEAYEEGGVRVRVKGSPAVVARLRQRVPLRA